MNLNSLHASRDGLQARAREIRTGSSDLSGAALTDAQREHRNIMQRITQLNEAINSHN